ncbi:MAG: hypothetical protein J6V55_00230 [Alistipes sp.]|nr:hypothetical protein [Alistipes sp.]
MKKIAILLVAVFALLGVNTANAQSRTSYFMEGSYFRSEFNPALVPTRGYFMIPGMSGFNLNIGTNFLSFDNFIYQRGDQYVTAFHKSVTTEEFLNKLPKTLKGNVSGNVNLLGLGFYTKKIFWTAGANLRIDNNIAMSPDMFKAAKSLGNGSYDLGTTAVNANWYLETYAGTTFPITDWLTIGVKGKILFGLANFGAELNNNMNITEDKITVEVDGNWRANSPILTNHTLVEGRSVDFSSLVCVNDMARLQENLKNFGAAIDFGAEMRLLNNHLKLSAAVTDLGFIKWCATSHLAGEASAAYEYTGVALSVDGDVDYKSAFAPMNGGEGINKDNIIQKGGYEGYINRLSYSINVGAEYNLLRNKIAFGIFSQTKVLNTSTYEEITASVNLRPTNWISATVSHTLLNGNSAGVYGAAINFHPALINIYLGVDFIDSNYVGIGNVAGLDLYLPRNANSLNLYMGMAFNFGRPKHLKNKANRAE